MTSIPLPTFLKRTAGDARTVFSTKTVKPADHSVAGTVTGRHSNGIHPMIGPIGEANILRLRRLSAKERARGTVLKAIQGGADTFGKIRIATGIEDDGLIRSALRRYIQSGRVDQNGRRYTTFGDAR